MKTKKFLAALLIGLGCSGLFLACGADPGEVTATSTSGSSSSSSSGEGGMGGSPMVCEQKYTCEMLVEKGFSDTMCAEDGAAQKYVDIFSCIQSPNVQSNCSNCVGLKEGDSISQECLVCAAQETDNPPCKLGCELCDKYDTLVTCEICSQYGGCQFNQPTPNMCYGGVVAYTDQIGCLQQTAVQANCPACQDENTVGSVITAECVSCARKHAINGCVFDCATALGFYLAN